MNSKNTFRALLGSVLAITLCLAMLVGTTFAWFTDKEVTGVNTIVSGNLDIEFSYMNATAADFVPVTAEADDLFIGADGSDILWEPGVVSVCYFKVENAGSLALKYNMAVNSQDVVVGDDGAALSLVLKTAVVEIDKDVVGTLGRTDAKNLALANGAESVLTYNKNAAMNSGDVTYLAMVVYYPEEIGNTYNGMLFNRADGKLTTELYVTLLATQQMKEDDSFNNEYDENAILPSISAGTVTLGQPVVISGSNVAVSAPADSLVYEDGSAVADDTDVFVKVTPSTDSESGITLAEGETIDAFDISLETAEGLKVKAAEGEAITVTLNIGANRNGALTLYHNGNDITSSIVSYTKSTGELVFTTASFSPFAVVEAPSATADTSWYNDTDKEFTITTADQLFGLSAIVNGGNNLSGKTIKLGADINLYNIDWTPIGLMTSNSSYKVFSGSFDGNGHTIKNLNVKSDIYYGLGLFGRCENIGKITNFTLENVNINNPGALHVGAVAGYPFTGNEISDITVTGDVKIVGYSYVGGIVGSSYVANIKNCKILGNENSVISCNYIYTGGIAGFRGESNSENGIVIDGCVVKNITIQNTASGWSYIGGISGQAHGGNTIKNCVLENVTVQTLNANIQTQGDESDKNGIGAIAGIYSKYTNGTYPNGVPVHIENNTFNGKIVTVCNINNEGVVGLSKDGTAYDFIVLADNEITLN